MSACALVPLTSVRVDPASPIAPEVARMARANRDYPSFSEIPVRATDVRPLRAFGRAASELERVRDDLVQATAPASWTLDASENFAVTARRNVGPDLAPPEPSDTEAFVREQRRRATPPPPPKR